MVSSDVAVHVAGWYGKLAKCQKSTAAPNASKRREECFVSWYQDGGDDNNMIVMEIRTHKPGVHGV